MNNQIRRIFILAMMLMLVLTCVKLKIDIKAEDSVPTVKAYSEQTVNGILSSFSIKGSFQCLGAN